jgi:hypothetical protein
MDLRARFRRRESGLLAPVEEAKKRPRGHLDDIADEALKDLAPIKTVDALMQARVIRDQQLSALASLRRSDLASLEARYKALRQRVWDEYREAEAKAKSGAKVAA